MMVYQYDPDRQIKYLELKAVGTNYRCKYPALLAAWLRKRGWQDETPRLNYQLAVLSKEGIHVIEVHRSGSVIVRGTGEAWQIVYKLFKPLLED